MILIQNVYIYVYVRMHVCMYSMYVCMSNENIYCVYNRYEITHINIFCRIIFLDMNFLTKIKLKIIQNVE